MYAQGYKRNVHIVERWLPGITLRTYMRSDADSVASPRFHVQPFNLLILPFCRFKWSFCQKNALIFIATSQEMPKKIDT